MTRREQLLEQYEEALFALLMEENVPGWDGEMEQTLDALEQDSAAQVSGEADRRSLETIRLALAGESRRKRRVKWGGVRPILAAACLTLAFLAGGVLGPTLVREGALGALLAGIGVSAPEGVPELTVGWLPGGWAFVYSTTTRDRAVVIYTDGAGGTLRLELCAPSVAATVATTLPQGAERVEVQGRKATLAQVGDRLELSWRTGEDRRVGVEATGLGREELLALAEELHD